MKISLKVEYACRVLAQLGRTYGAPELPHIEELAKAEDVPANYLVQILNELRAGGLIVSKRGKQGGYSLSRNSSEISLYDIIRAIDGEVLDFSREIRGQSGPRVAQIFGELATSFEQQTKAYTVEDMQQTGTEEMYFI